MVEYKVLATSVLLSTLIGVAQGAGLENNDWWLPTSKVAEVRAGFLSSGMPAWGGNGFPVVRRVIGPVEDSEAKRDPEGAQWMGGSQSANRPLPELDNSPKADCAYDVCAGPDYEYKLPSKAVPHVKAGQTLGIQAGDYRDCLSIRKPIGIAGFGGRPHLHDKICNGKGVIVVFAKGVTTIENLEISAGRQDKAVWLHNGAGTVIARGLDIHNSSMGLFAGNRAQGFEIYNSVIHDMNSRDELSHFVYTGTYTGKFVMRGNYLHDRNREGSGHFIKCKSYECDIRYNLLENTRWSDADLVDLWGCGSNIFVGNLLVRSPRDYGGIVVKSRSGVRFPCEREHNSSLIAYNTFVKLGTLEQRKRAHFMKDLFNEKPHTMTVENNVVVNAEFMIKDGDKERGDLAINVLLQEPHPELFADLHGGDYRAREGFPAVEGSVQPESQYRHPAAMEPRSDPAEMGAFNVIGAVTQAPHELTIRSGLSHLDASRY